MKRILRPSLNLLIILFCVLSLGVSSAFAAITETQAKDKYETAKNLIHTYSGDGDNYQQAVTLANNIYQADPQSPYAYLIIAELKARQYKDYGEGDLREIWALTDKVISLNSKIADAYVIRSKMYLIATDIKQAQSEADQAIRLDAGNREAMFAKAQAEEASGNFAQAELWYRNTIEAHVDPDRKSNIYFWLGKMYLKMTPPQISKADESMEQACKLSPSAPWKLVNYAIFLNTDAGNYEKAAEYAQKALAVMDFPMGHFQLGIARYGKWAMAFSRTRNPTSNQLVQAKEDIAAIQNETGITPAEASKYATQYMGKSSIPQALHLARAL